LRIIEACFTPSLGGLELYCLNTAKQLQDRGHQVELWLADGSRTLQHPITEDVPTRIFREPGYVSPMFCWKANRQIQNQPVDVIHLHRSKDLAPFARINDVSRVFTLQIDSTLKKRDIFHKYVFAKADRILTITDRMRKLALNNLPVRADRVFTLHYGIDIDKLKEDKHAGREFRMANGIPEDSFLIGMIGRLEHGKGQHILLEVLTDLVGDYPNLHVVIVGDPPPGNEGYDEELKAQARALNIADRAHFTGFILNTADAYNALDTFVLASKKESFGLVLLEAMALNVPIIATNAGGVPEIIQHGINGLLIAPEDPGALKNVLLQLLEEPQLRIQLAGEGKHIVREKFSLNLHLNRLLAHFEEAVAAHT